MTGQENFQALVKQKTEEMRKWQQELEEREQQQEVDYQLLDKKITELEEFDKYLKTREVNFTKELLSAKEDRLKKEEENLSFKKKQLDYEEQSTKELLKKLWGVWIFWIVVAIVSALISIFFVHGYLASDNRALNTYNKALLSYNTSIEKLNDQITDKQTRLASKEETWITYDCDNNDYGESMCPETKIASLKSQINDLEQQKKELVKPQEPTL